MNEFDQKAHDAKVAADNKAALDRAAAHKAEVAKTEDDLDAPDPLHFPRHQVHVAHVPTPTTEETQKAVADAKEAADREVAKTVTDRNWQDVLDRAIGQGHPITSSIDQNMINEEADKAAEAGKTKAERDKDAKVAANKKSIEDARIAGLAPDAEARRQRGIDEAKAKADAAARAKADAEAKPRF